MSKEKFARKFLITIFSLIVAFLLAIEIIIHVIHPTQTPSFFQFLDEYLLRLTVIYLLLVNSIDNWDDLREEIEKEG